MSYFQTKFNCSYDVAPEEKCRQRSLVKRDRELQHQMAIPLQVKQAASHLQRISRKAHLARESGGSLQGGVVLWSSTEAENKSEWVTH